MGDMGDIWRETKDIRKRESDARKNRNFDNAVRRLKNAEIDYDIMPNGIHFVVSGKSEKIDYWPTTGKYICRQSKKSGRGINSLIKAARREIE